MKRMSDPSDSGAYSMLLDARSPLVVSDGSSRLSHAAAALRRAMLIWMSSGGTDGGGSVSNVRFCSKVYEYDKSRWRASRERCSQLMLLRLVTSVTPSNTSCERSAMSEDSIGSPS